MFFSQKKNDSRKTEDKKEQTSNEKSKYMDEFK